MNNGKSIKELFLSVSGKIVSRQTEKIERL